MVTSYSAQFGPAAVIRTPLCPEGAADPGGVPHGPALPEAPGAAVVAATDPQPATRAAATAAVAAAATDR
ncbi:hypothetical protein [Kitasatospora sp. NPDC090091]|uniref:hypothetical protein n=1 Tax=Kitasatospora sp. NPDC090091 TaxID=3364081 RepID=UPI00381B15FE